MYAVNELFGHYTNGEAFPDLSVSLDTQECPFNRSGVCTKMRKSDPKTKIGTCSLVFKSCNQPLLICPDRLTEGKKIFLDCLQYVHVTGGELYLVPEIKTAVGSIDYVLAVIRDGSVQDFVGIELQTLDTVGTIWDERQNMLADYDLADHVEHNGRRAGVNWRMTAKTILAQMIQKCQLFARMGRKMVLVCQSPLLSYMQKNFDFSGVHAQSASDVFNINAYDYVSDGAGMKISLACQLGSDLEGVEHIMGFDVRGDSALEMVNERIVDRLAPEFKFTPFAETA